MGFEIWDGVHDTDEQKKRRAKAATAELTPLAVDADARSGHFSGSSGEYVTTLEECPCGDFRRRHLPCKHIYRLAMELGVLPDEHVSDASKIKHKKPDGYGLQEAVAISENLTDEARDFVRGAFARILYGPKGEVLTVQRSHALEEAIEYGILCVTNDNGDRVTVDIADAFQRPARKLYSYLLYREGKYGIADSDGSGTLTEYEVYPENEEILRLLIMFAPHWQGRKIEECSNKTTATVSFTVTLDTTIGTHAVTHETHRPKTEAPRASTPTVAPSYGPPPVPTPGYTKPKTPNPLKGDKWSDFFKWLFDFG